MDPERASGPGSKHSRAITGTIIAVWPLFVIGTVLASAVNLNQLLIYLSGKGE